jgi:hypothetical protein
MIFMYKKLRQYVKPPLLTNLGNPNIILCMNPTKQPAQLLKNSMVCCSTFIDVLK